MRGASTAATDSAAIILMDGTLNKLIQLFDIALTITTKVNYYEYCTEY